MSTWTHVDDSLPMYGEWVFVIRGVTPPQQLVAYRHHTDWEGEHWWGVYNPSRDSNEVEDVTHWCAAPPFKPTDRGCV